MSTIRQRLIRSLGANTISQVINASFQVLSVPMFIQSWGMTLYGEWLLLSTLPAYLALSDMGFSSVTGNKMTMSEGANDRHSALRVFQSSYIFVSIVCFIIGFSIYGLWLADVGSWLNLQLISHDSIAIIFILFYVLVVSNLQINLLYAAFRASGNNALAVWLDNFSRIAEISIVFVVLYIGEGPVVVAAVMAGVRGLSYWIVRRQLRVVAPWVVVGSRYAARNEILKMLRPAIAFTGFPIGNAIKNQGFLMVVGFVLGPAAVVPFSTTRTLVNSAQQVLNVINSSVWPEFSRAFGANDISLARKLHRISCRATLWLAVVALSFLAVLGDEIYFVWTLGEVELDHVFFMLMLLTAFINSIWYASSVVLVSSNRHETLAGLFIAGNLLAISLSYVFAPIFGLVAVALSLIVVELLIVMYVLLASLQLVQDTIPQFLRAMVLPRPLE